MEPASTSEGDRAQSAHLSSDVGPSTSLPLLKKRKIRHSRVKTGCQACRGRRVKCKEGLLLASGLKLPCDQCHDVRNDCYYPDPEDTGRTTTRWIISAQVDEHGRMVPRASEKPEKVLVKQEASLSGSAAGHGISRIQQSGLQRTGGSHIGSAAMISVKRETNDGEFSIFPSSVKAEYHRQPPQRHHSEVKIESLPLDRYYMNTPLQEYFTSSAAPTLTASTSQGQPLFAESALRSQVRERPSSAQRPINVYPSIPRNDAVSGITLDRIPKGIGTSSHWPANVNRQPLSMAHPWTFAQPPYAEAIATAARTPFASFSSGDASVSSRWSPGNQSRPANSEEFRLQLTRMPWVKRTPMHIDYTRSRSISKTAERQDDKYVADALYQYLNKTNQPVRPLRIFSLATLIDSPLKRAAMSYFETRGCAEIIAIDVMESNWIHVHLFPRIYEVLSDDTLAFPRKSIETPASNSGRGVVTLEPTDGGSDRAFVGPVTRDFIHHSLIRLSCVHRVNTETDPGRIQELRREIVRHGRLAMMAGLQVRVQFPAKYSRSEEYLMGAFIGYMADMLDSQVIRVEPEILVPDQDRSPSAFEKILREMLAVYVTLMKAFRPHDPLCFDEHSTHELSSPRWASDATPPSAPEISPVDWVEAFFGLTRSTIQKIQLVNSLVAQRAELLRTGQDNGEPGQKLRQAATALAMELGVDDGDNVIALSWKRIDGAIGKPGRVRRGTNVMRLALSMIVLCEILEVDLDDSRLVQARNSTMEMVADSEASETAGLSWALTIAAIYANPPARAPLTSLLRTTQETSFGVNYVHATLEILSICWKVLSVEGTYRNGIAPWREAMAVVGRSMFL